MKFNLNNLIHNNIFNKKTFIKTGLLIVLGVLIILFSTFIPLSKSDFTPNKIISTKIVDRNGIILRKILSVKQGTASWVDIEQIPTTIKEAFITTEDKRFYSHNGIDVVAILRAILNYIKYQKIISGASTITQQVTRNIYNYPRNIFTKIFGIWMAQRLEHTLSKNEILEQYLNRIPFGNQTFGIGAAADLYFSKPVKDLTTAEAVFLAAIPKSPTNYNPYRYFERTLKRQKKNLNLMLRNGLISENEFQRITKEKIVLSNHEVSFKAPHFCNQIILQNINENFRSDKIYTTLDWHFQKNIQYFIKGRLQELSSYNVHNASILVMENSTGEILVWIGSHDFFDHENAGQVDGVIALRQPGSALKPFTYGLALQHNMTAASVIPDIETQAKEVGGYYTPKNYDEQFHGPIRLRNALACSYNIPPIRILEELGGALLLETLQQAGFISLNKSAEYYGKGLTLGNGEVTLLELVRAYAAIANGGKLIREKLVRKIHYPNNQIINFSTQQGSMRVIFDKEINAILIDILSDNDARIPAFGKYSPLNFSFDCAAKTGTSKDYRDNWAVGCTPEITVGVWVGNFSGEPMHNVSGISGAGPLLNDILNFLDKYINFSSFIKPDGLVKLEICSISGKIAGPICPETKDEFFRPVNLPIDTCSWHRLIPIDIRNGQLATKSTDNCFIEDQIFLDLPPIYLSWMVENDIPLIPKDSTTFFNNEKKNTFINRLQIISPKDNEIYKMDKILHLKYQQIKLEVEVPGYINQIRWHVNGKLYRKVTRPFKLSWQLQPGEYQFQVIADENKSNITKILVLP